MITPCSTINGEEINRDLENNFSVLIMTFLPFKDKSLIILAAFDNEKQSVKILDDLEKLRKENHFLYRKYLTFLIFHEENTFISPKFFDKKPEEWKQEYFNP